MSIIMAQSGNYVDTDQNNDFSQVVDVLTNMFGQVMDNDAINAIVESCDGNLEHSIEVMMSIVNDEPPDTSNPETVGSANPGIMNLGQAVPPASNLPTTTPSQPTMSYSSASKSTGALPKKTVPVQKNNQRRTKKDFVPNDSEIKRIIDWHLKGYRILIIMRGPSGSGKSYLARQIIDEIIRPNDGNYQKHIFSTDDFFYVRGNYEYNKSRLSEAHDWNHNRVRMAARQGLSPIIVDNTNIAIWETQPYVTYGVGEGYYIEVIEPKTPWAKSAYELCKRNSHNVPLVNIRRMLENFQYHNVTGQQLIQNFNLMYPEGKKPPMLRNIPPITHFETRNTQSPPKIAQESKNQNTSVQQNQITDKPHPTTSFQNNQIPENPIQIDHENAFMKSIENKIQPDNSKSENESENNPTKSERYIEIMKKLEELQKVEQEWEKCEDWEENQSKTVQSMNEPSAADIPNGPKTQRRNQVTSDQQLLPSVNDDDWRSITRFMPAWADSSEASKSKRTEKRTIESKSCGTCMEIGDADLNATCYRVITAKPKDINIFYIETNNSKIPNKIMLDKSSMTNEQSLTNNHRCKNEEKHFKSFRKMFKHITKSDLKEIFDKCMGDVNWAVDIVLEGVANNEIQTNEEAVGSESEEETGQCECVANYDIIPDTFSDNTETPSTAVENKTPVENKTQTPQKKVKKDKNASESSLELKKQLEQNIVISDAHYSQHSLKIRKQRRGENDNLDPRGLNKLDPNPVVPSTSTQIVPYNVSEAESNGDISDDESDTSVDACEETVNVNLGRDFVIQLDELYGRKDMTYPSNIVPFVNMPMSTLERINALWIESLTHQIEAQANYSEILLKEDADFARELAEKEAELAQQGKEPEVPDFKEIMDMELAMSLYQKDVDEWRNKEPTDIAAKMTRTKLINLFPEVPEKVLSELLMAHDHHFKTTVEVLMVSMGHSKKLEEDNGLNRFVMQREIARQERLLEEERKKELSEQEWPMLKASADVDMSTVDAYRQQAMQHLERRNGNHTKAQDYIRRGMTQVAAHYNSIAMYHKKQFEQANSLAASSLIQVNAANRSNTTLDLHYLFVAEAVEALDLFLDHHIQALRNESARQNTNTLFLITGRGKNSPAGPRIKPAVKRRLKERGYAISQLNPGLLSVEIRRENLLTHQIETA
ncbi:unnamed protein product [Plutella xylostella]|uniref:(diamondback moth) hypothetical protein n=1 Tax=Plutella xylostella TaxID=51655 RepID=A0A8S4FYB7_PLUXY|nr:unnamed protein product [Plutella xylostella]